MRNVTNIRTTNTAEVLAVHKGSEQRTQRKIGLIAMFSMCRRSQFKRLPGHKSKMRLLSQKYTRRQRQGLF